MFAKSEILDLFATLSIRVVHGWLLDPSDRALDPINRTGYNNAVLLVDKMISEKDEAAGVSGTDPSQCEFLYLTWFFFSTGVYLKVLYVKFISLSFLYFHLCRVKDKIFS